MFMFSFYLAGRIRIGWRQRRKGQLGVFIRLQVEQCLVLTTLFSCQLDWVPLFGKLNIEFIPKSVHIMFYVASAAPALEHQSYSNHVNLPYLNESWCGWLFGDNLWPTSALPTCFRGSHALCAPLSESYPLTPSPVSWPKPCSRRARRESLGLGREESK